MSMVPATMGAVMVASISSRITDVDDEDLATTGDVCKIESSLACAVGI